jgi:hypothetical protein
MPVRVSTLATGGRPFTDAGSMRVGGDASDGVRATVGFAASTATGSPARRDGSSKRAFGPRLGCRDAKTLRLKQSWSEQVRVVTSTRTGIGRALSAKQWTLDHECVTIAVGPVDSVRTSKPCVVVRVTRE